MKKVTLTRWVITSTGFDYKVKEKEVSRHMPINRMVDDVGYYPFLFIELDKHVYYYTFYEEEHNLCKSAVMVGRFNKSDEGLIPVDMTSSDFNYFDDIVKVIFAECFNLN